MSAGDTTDASPSGTSHNDVTALFVSRAARLVAFGATSVALAFHLAARGFGEAKIGLLVSLTLVGDAALTLLVGLFGERLGRKRLLVASALFMAAGLVVFGLARAPWVLFVTATVGILSPSGGEAGPATAVEQAALASARAASERPRLYAWYSFMGSASVALGSKLGGTLAARFGPSAVFVGASALVLVGSLPLLGLSRGIEAKAPPPRRPLEKSRGIVGVLSVLFALDSFGSGLVLQSALALWLHLRFGFGTSTLGTLFFVVNLLSAASALVAARLAKRIGLLATMVATHIPANLFLLALAFAPTGTVALALVCLRYCLAQMDVPARMAFVMRAVPEEERTQASVVTSLAKSAGNALGPALTGALLAAQSFAVPVVLAATVKIAYDLGLFAVFRAHDAEHRRAEG